MLNGMRASKTAFFIDGVNASNQWVDGVVVQPAPDAIQEFKVQSNALSAEFGQGGGIISIELRSGTNDYHVTLFEFIRNDVLDARNFFNAPPAKQSILKQNQFGFTAGGPVIEVKTFFFGDYQGRRERRGVIFNNPVGSVKMRAGDFSELSATIFDPATTRPDPANPGRTIRDPFPDNKIPSNRLSPQALYFIDNNYILPPNTPEGNYNRSGSRISDTDQFDLRGDHQLGRNTSLFGSYSFQQNTLVSPGLFHQWSSRRPDPDQRTSAGLIHFFGPRLITRSGPAIRARDPLTKHRASGRPTIRSSRNWRLRRNQREVSGFPGFAITGYGGIDALTFRPGFRRSNQYNVIDNLTWGTGEHNLKLGFDLRWFSVVDENCASAVRTSLLPGHTREMASRISC